MLLYRWLNEAVENRGTAKALVYRDTYLSWRGMQHRVERRAQEFAAMGIEKGHWVGLMLGNVPDFAILALALSRLGATVVPLDPTTGVRDLTLFLEHAPLRALITRPRGGNELPSSQAPIVRTRKDTRFEPESRRRLQGTLLTCSIYRRDEQPPAEAEAVLLTADTSGDPKGVLRTADNLMANCENIAASLDVTADAKILTTVPLFSAYGFDLGLCLALRYGATLYLEDEMSPKRIAKLIREQEIDFLPATPPIYASLAKMPTARPLKTRGARFLATGAQLPEAIADSFRERWGIRVLPIYHTTEGGAISLDRKGLAPETVGKPIPGVELRMGTGDDDGRAPIWIRSKAVALHSVGPMSHIRPGEARSKKGEARAVPIGGIDAEGCLRTGDRGKIDRTNRLTLLGREDDLVKVEGKRVALGEVEGCLESYPKVKAAQARVFTDEDGSTMVVASVVLSGRCRAEELIDHCAKNLAPYKVPRRVELRGSLTDELGGQECAR
ncbi:MAG TPA: class I adenylate-forming enzyme family protein [Pseudomonadota bacterium]|nr:class I adenylate-forming enzyme family protein [Pseudomonadota bacterium]